MQKMLMMMTMQKMMMMMIMQKTMMMMMMMPDGDGDDAENDDE